MLVNALDLESSFSVTRLSEYDYELGHLKSPDYHMSLVYHKNSGWIGLDIIQLRNVPRYSREGRERFALVCESLCDRFGSEPPDPSQFALEECRDYWRYLNTDSDEYGTHAFFPPTLAWFHDYVKLLGES